jgi:WD40 repeat protein
MAKTITRKPTWTHNPLPGSKQLYINSVGISKNAQSAICGNYYYDYSKTANHTTSAPTFEVGTFFYNAKGKLQWKDVFQATEGVYWVAVSDDADWAASGGLVGHGSGFINAYDASNGKKTLNFTTSARVNRVAMSGNGSCLIAGADSAYFFVRTGSTWSGPQKIPCAAGDHVVAVDISTDGKCIALGTAKGVVMLAKNTAGVLSTPISWPQANGSIYWVQMASDGSGFAVGGDNASVMFFNTSTFHQGGGPEWTTKLTGCTRCGAVGISGDGKYISAVGNSGKAGKVFLFSNGGTKAKTLWSAPTLHNPNSTSIDASGTYVTVADGQPDGTPGAFYLFDITGKPQWRCETSNMSWPMQISQDATGIVAGSDNAKVYYFGL